MTVGATAPGKLMLVGEYAVLEGGVSVVAAVDARAEARLLAPGTPAPVAPRPTPEADEARRLAEVRLGPAPGALAIDVSALRRDGQKLGLGSSAAAAAAAAGAVFAFHGHDVTDPATRRLVLEDALAGHRAVAPEGSGADVAASVLGGFVRFRRVEERVEADTLAWPEGLVGRVVWTGKEARTSDFVRKVYGLRKADRARFVGAMRELAGAAQRFVDAFGRGDVPAVVAAAGAYGDAMASLGAAAGAPIVEEALRRVADLATAAGGASKPSGAGGGDVAVAFFAGEGAAARFDAACAAEGMDVLDIRLGATGVLPQPS